VWTQTALADVDKLNWSLRHYSDDTIVFHVPIAILLHPKGRPRTGYLRNASVNWATRSGKYDWSASKPNSSLAPIPVGCCTTQLQWTAPNESTRASSVTQDPATQRKYIWNGLF